MASAFRKISRVGSLTGGTKWYLSDDCLLAAKRMMYAVEYRRFYLHDLESIVVWPSRLWALRVIIPGALLAALSASLWEWANSTAGQIFGAGCVTWIALELALGPTAKSRIRSTGTTIDLPLVKRTRRAKKVLAKIDAAVRATRAGIEQAPAPASNSESSEPEIAMRSAASTPDAIAAATQTNGS